MPEEKPKKTCEEVIDSLGKMSPDEAQAKIKEFDEECICGICPSFVGTGETKLTFCIIGKSMVIEKENGCLCPGCPVQVDLNLTWQYYCTKGSCKEMAGMQ